MRTRGAALMGLRHDCDNHTAKRRDIRAFFFIWIDCFIWAVIKRLF
ncbi:hypothetical protein Dd586_3808 [Dickeya parazeae Ech586]|uniref:Uncharacterized protein n=1 Tax=Dickeya zeae (strain Ech586) TaxID=590409 RepID=D2BY46_DICZ5|nr:hypothetical protein Dd586_3808 [Dickeya parazeae Ech586]